MVNQISFRVTCQRISSASTRKCAWARCRTLLTSAGDMNADVQRIMSTPEYRNIFPGAWLGNKPDDGVAVKRNTDEFGIANHKGTYVCAGVGGPLTGKKIDLGIIDDPIKKLQRGAVPDYQKNRSGTGTYPRSKRVCPKTVAKSSWRPAGRQMTCPVEWWRKPRKLKCWRSPPSTNGAKRWCQTCTRSTSC